MNHQAYDAVGCAFAQPIVEYAQYIGQLIGSPVRTSEILPYNGLPLEYHEEKYEMQLTTRLDLPTFPDNFLEDAREALKDTMMVCSSRIASLFTIFVSQSTSKDDNLHYVFIEYDMDNQRFIPHFTSKNLQIDSLKHEKNVLEKMLHEKSAEMTQEDIEKTRELIEYYQNGLKTVKFNSDYEIEANEINELLQRASPYRFAIVKINT